MAAARPYSLDMSVRRVSLRAQRSGDDQRFLEAYLDEAGDLHIDGQDFGPGTGPLGANGEHEWFQLIRAADLPALRALMEIDPDADLLDGLERSWSGPAQSVALETLIWKSAIPVEIDTWRR